MAHILNTSYVGLLLIFFTIILHHACIAADDSISIHRPLTGTNNLTSNGGNFVLGFFTPDTNKHYIAIWYNTDKISQLTTVWQANRESPITRPTGSQLKISETDGNLVLLDESKYVIWSTSVSIPLNMSTIAVLLDNGNLQLRSESNSSQVLWQSFDHPTNTWLPRAKFGYNKKTKQSQQLTPWKNSVNPASGIFALATDLEGSSQYYLMWNKSKVYWQSGLWSRIEHKFSNIPEMVGYVFDFNYVNTTDERYFMYSVIDDSFTVRVVLDVSGQIQQWSWVEASQQWILIWTEPKKLCEIYALCGANGVCHENSATICNCPEGFSEKHPHEWAVDDHSGGCVRNTPLQLTSEFLPILNVRLPENPQNLTVRSGEACKMVCTNNSSCTAYSFGDSWCSVWHGDLFNLQEQYNGLDAATLYLRVAPTKTLRTKSNKAVVWWLVASVLAAAFLAIIVFLISRFHRRVAASTKNVASGTLVRFKYYELQQATKNFSEKLGSGGFGMVYKGALPDSTVIAVKKLEGIQQGEKQFRTEVSTIGTLQHVNLVRLLGFCSEASKRLLVYEYMPLGSLASQLFQKNSVAMDWETRYVIAIGIARGLLYLHEECRECIIHCDIKPENILLDENFVPKVADFGLAKLLGREFSRVLTTLRGTRGYLAPEWISGMPITAKADVYSYGMMLFEIISGRRNLEQVGDGNSSFYFPTFAATKLVAGDVSSLVDSRLGGEANIDTVGKACKLAFWCIQDDENGRPTIGQVVQVLEGFLEINIPQIPKSLDPLSPSSEKNDFFLS